MTQIIEYIHKASFGFDKQVITNKFTYNYKI